MIELKIDAWHAGGCLYCGKKESDHCKYAHSACYVKLNREMEFNNISFDNEHTCYTCGKSNRIENKNCSTHILIVLSKKLIETLINKLEL